MLGFCAGSAAGRAGILGEKKNSRAIRSSSKTSLTWEREEEVSVVSLPNQDLEGEKSINQIELVFVQPWPIKGVSCKRVKINQEKNRRTKKYLSLKSNLSLGRKHDRKNACNKR